MGVWAALFFFLAAPTARGCSGPGMEPTPPQCQRRILNPRHHKGTPADSFDRVIYLYNLKPYDTCIKENAIHIKTMPTLHRAGGGSLPIPQSQGFAHACLRMRTRTHTHTTHHTDPHSLTQREMEDSYFKKIIFKREAYLLQRISS